MKPIRLVIFLPLLFIGCASLPSQFANETPPLSTSDTNAVIAAANVRQDLPILEEGLETSIPFANAEATKNPATLTRICTLEYYVGTGLKAFTGTGTVSTTLVADSAKNLNTRVDSTDLTLINGAANLVQTALNGVTAHLETLANATSNPDAHAYILATIPMAVSDLGTALVVANQAYAPTVLSALADISHKKELMARASYRAVKVVEVATTDHDYLLRAIRADGLSSTSTE